MQIVSCMRSLTTEFGFDGWISNLNLSGAIDLRMRFGACQKRGNREDSVCVVIRTNA